MSATNASPQYRQVADTLRRRILNGEYREGDIIPTAAELEKLFSVSNITIRKALAILSDEGWVAGQRGVGTIVKSSAPDHRVKIAVSGNFAQWVDSASGKSLPVEQKILDISVIRPAPARVAAILGVATGAPLWTMRRLRWIAGNVVSYHLNYGLPHRLGRIDERKMANNRNFIDVLRTDLGIELHRMDQLVEATVADRDLAELLEAQFGDPVFFVENVYSDADGEIAAVTHLYLRGDHYAYQTSMTLDDVTAPEDQLQ